MRAACAAAALVLLVVLLYALQVVELKQELKHLGASQAGLKSDLQQRLLSFVDPQHEYNGRDGLKVGSAAAEDASAPSGALHQQV